MTALPRGFTAYVANLGVKDETDDFVVIAADTPVAAAGVFTRSIFAGPSVTASRVHVADRRAQAMVVVSKNANVANGPDGDDDNRAVVAAVARQLGCDQTDVLIASTGVIGRRYPIDRMLHGIGLMPPTLPDSDIDGAARGIMTTDTVPKIAERTVADSAARIVGIAKGSGMIEPHMATMIAVVVTDADVDSTELGAQFTRVADQTFNCISVDTDSSTSDTAVVLASGAAGPVDSASFEQALFGVARDLAKQIVRDGEGAEKLIEVHVDEARDGAQAKRVAKAIVNSPLVKTAVHGADPNWGRVAMAIGKCDGDDDRDIDPDHVVIRFGEQRMYPDRASDEALDALSKYLAGDEILIHVSLGTGKESCTVWGCDLTDGYIRINADYTT
ncbi:MAG: bifunctional glutamate N-acetyltransferase/amino-acid acetyltransferase ArgJ [Actinomycetota bacterium]|nr:bifunctional glutamate N-acetyltransferase/amino-acid acetyltransferase ArgJ [Actinomycetota bacterium]